MSDVDLRLVAAVREQLARRPRGAGRVGWKVGSGDGERIGDEPIAVGHLTSASVLEPGAAYRGGGDDLRADAEVAVELGADRSVVGYAVALELCDLAGSDEPEEVVAANVYHRAVAFGPFAATMPESLEASVLVNGVPRGRGRVVDPVDRVAAVERVLRAVAERLEPGDRLITGSIVQVPVRPGDEVVAELESLGRVALEVA